MPNKKNIVSFCIPHGGLAQLARAPALQAGGHRFESDILHSFEMFCVARQSGRFRKGTESGSSPQLIPRSVFGLRLSMYIGFKDQESALKVH